MGVKFVSIAPPIVPLIPEMLLINVIIFRSANIVFILIVTYQERPILVRLMEYFGAFYYQNNGPVEFFLHLVPVAIIFAL